jgi:hypothetical protein
MNETYVQVGPDSTGKQIRNLKITERSVDISGTETLSDRYVQVVAIADADSGLAIDFTGWRQIETELLQRILIELRVLNLAFFEQSGSKGTDPVAMAREIDI